MKRYSIFLTIPVIYTVLCSILMPLVFFTTIEDGSQVLSNWWLKLALIDKLLVTSVTCFMTIAWLYFIQMLRGK
jgi:hypothetical protein